MKWNGLTNNWERYQHLVVPLVEPSVQTVAPMSLSPEACTMSIIGQFLMERLIVMLCNTLLAVVITVDALAIYKLYQYFVLGTTWIVSVSIHSLLMFAVCSLGLTLVFSLFFAYRATRVEIVKYLKAE